VAAAQIRIDQASNPSPLGVAGYARDDIEKGAAVTLRNGDPAGVKSSRWSLLSRPYGSSASITNPTSAVATIVPDVPGSYRIRLEINQGGPGEYDIRTLHVRDAAGMCLPAVSERAPEDNYRISPGVYNQDGHARELNERQLRALDNRDDPLVVNVAGGSSTIVAIDWGLPMAILESLEIVTDISILSEFAACADAAGSIVLHSWTAIDATTGWHMFETKTLAGLLGVPLEDNKVYLYIRNNDANSDYSVYYRIKAP
jgi:hypothetical protein